MLNLILIVFALVCAIQAVTATRLMRAALWLAGVSALTAILLFRIGAHEVAVIELSVGAGLVTVLFVFAIAIAGEDAMGERPIVPRWIALPATLIAVILFGWMILPVGAGETAAAAGDFSTMLWHERGLDTLVQVGLIFAGVVGVLGLLAPARAPFPVRRAEPLPPLRAEPGAEPVAGQEG
ncbi:MAG: NADH-quinone oxidoreductase subunit J [Anaerolineae bacterium]|nr:NADH-quinone oxidoreductase subunit J [Anaerolineae bacterium]